MTRTEETLTRASPSTSELVSYRNSDGLILSTGNLYFTYHDAATAKRLESRPERPPRSGNPALLRARRSLW
jgi:hypothetical protein